ncbi:hypothetical protein QA640_22850 [Bradyrhizobium sp. CB82]|uniref:helix-turn-helix transcriptional regulator n=1 Tax=Bradyrhizobium sp. CB82 TaxID=3039159 RepID=UPI0024B27CF6|nr:hypothetical protein [Bradyrhizobium sp. CB82]WFU37334.1 hypothetical protein QA640_22850 [Bradyrhizobium sp. CB82]
MTSSISPRLLSGADAAAYCGVTPATWSKWVAEGIMPKPLAGTRRWDKKAIDLVLDKASGIVAPSVEPEKEFARWEISTAHRERSKHISKRRAAYPRPNDRDRAANPYCFEKLPRLRCAITTPGLIDEIMNADARRRTTGRRESLPQRRCSRRMELRPLYRHLPA